MAKIVTEHQKSPVLHQTIKLEQPKTEEAEPKPDFWELMNSLSEQDWNEHIVYLYRTEPRTTMVRGTPGAYLTVLAKRFTPEDIKQQYGGGVFTAWLLGDGGRHRRAITQIEISGEPKYDLTREIPPGGSATPPAATGADATVMNRLLDMMREQFTSLRAQIISMQANPGPPAGAQDGVSVMKTAAETGMAMLLKQTPEPAAMMTATVEMMNKLGGGQSKLTEIVMTKLLERAFAAPETNILGQIDALLAIADKLSSRSGHGERSIATALIDSAPALVEKAATLFDRWRDVAREQRMSNEYRYAAIATARGAVPPPPGRPSPPVVELAGAHPSRPLAQPATASAPAVRPMEVEPLSPAIAREPEGAPSMDWVKRKIVWQIQQGAPGESVIDFIAGIDESLIVSLRAATKDQIREFFTSDSILREAVDSPQFDEFLDEAVRYLKENAAPVQ